MKYIFFKFKMADSRHVGKCWKFYNTPTDGLIGTKLGWSHPTFLLGIAANRTVNFLVLWGVQIKNIHNFDDSWMSLCHCVTKK